MPSHTSPVLLLLLVAAAHLLAMVSPGPAFVMVSRAAVAQSRAAGIATGLGVATAAFVWALAATLGVAALLQRAPALQAALQLAGGAYLAWIGWRSWRHARSPMPAAGDALPSDTRTLLQAWSRGVKSNSANPKVIVFFGSIFLTLFAPGTPAWVRVAALAIVACNETLWYVLVACAFASRPVQSAYRRAKTAIDRCMGVLLGGFGLRLVGGALSRLAA